MDDRVKDYLRLELLNTLSIVAIFALADRNGWRTLGLLVVVVTLSISSYRQGKLVEREQHAAQEDEADE